MGKQGGLLYGGIIGASNRVCPQGQLSAGEEPWSVLESHLMA